LVTTSGFPRDVVSAVTEAECAQLQRLASGKLVLELGSDYGRSTIVLAQTAALVFAVDWHKGDPHAGHRDTATEFIRNITRYGVRHKIVAVIGDASLAIPRMAESTFDFAFIDAFHEEAVVYNDAVMIIPKMKPAGVIAFHDYTVPHFGVKAAVDRLAVEIGARVELVTASLAVLPL
jgi:predicted O-methyltransferase YrrM